VRSNDANPAFSLLGEVMNMGQERLTRFGVSMPADLLDQFDEMLVTRGYNSRSEALRDLVRRELVEQKWEASAVHVTGILTIVYDHGAGVADALGSMQHAHHQEIVEDGQTGYLIPARHAEAIAGAVAHLAADPARRRALGEAGRQRVEAHFTQERMLTKLSSLYQSLLSSPQTRLPSRNSST
jgi:Arc/MetJ-type ribon-helix-helix transcriptional regulator